MAHTKRCYECRFHNVMEALHEILNEQRKIENSSDSENEASGDASSEASFRIIEGAKKSHLDSKKS